jgi:hypothetical protein
MKKITTLILLSCLCKIAFSQNNSKHADSIKFKHEFGVDATAFVKQFFNLNSSSVSYTYPIYYLTYRFHLKNSNVRAALGGNFIDRNNKAYSAGVRENIIYKSIDARIGYELIKKINTRWNIFYGLDFRPSTNYEKTDNANQINGYIQSNYTKSKTLGFAPLLGVKYQLNKRINLSTEISFTLAYSESEYKTTYKPIANQPAKPDNNKRDNYSWVSTFGPPVFVYFAFDL